MINGTLAHLYAPRVVQQPNPSALPFDTDFFFISIYCNMRYEFVAWLWQTHMNLDKKKYM